MSALCWPKLALSCPYVGLMVAYVGAMLALGCSKLALCWPYVGLSYPYLAPMLNLCSPMLALEMLSPIAVTETAEVTTGWERGRDGVGTGGSAAGAASLYNLRLPPKASGKDTGLGRCPAPGFKGYRPCRRPQQCGGSQLCVSEYKQSNGETVSCSLRQKWSLSATDPKQPYTT